MDQKDVSRLDEQDLQDIFTIQDEIVKYFPINSRISRVMEIAVIIL